MTEREQVIRGGLNKWVKADYKGILNYATGVGKTFGAILAVKHVQAKFPKKKILWVSPTHTIIDNTAKEFIKFGHETLLESVDFMCYHSIHKNQGREDSIVVLDEVHHITSELRMTYFENNSYTSVLGLSASLTREQLEILSPYMKVVDKISLQEAEEKGFIAPFTIINFPVTLTKKEKKLYDTYTSKINHVYHKYNRQDWGNISKRTSLLYTAENKIRALRDIMELFPKDRGIVLTMRKAQADEVEQALEGCVAIHSGHSKKEAKKRLDLFSDKTKGVSLLASPKIFDEGATLPEISFGVLLARSSKERQAIQTLGRLVRTDIEGKHAIAIRLYARKTKEEDWVQESQRNFNVINASNYEQLRHTIEETKSSN